MPDRSRMIAPIVSFNAIAESDEVEVEAIFDNESKEQEESLKHGSEFQILRHHRSRDSQGKYVWVSTVVLKSPRGMMTPSSWLKILD